MVEMELVGVRVELPTNAPIVLLRETSGDHRTLPIFIGGPEATAIAFALENVDVPRPMTHDLLKDVIDDLGVRLEKVVVTGAAIFAEEDVLDEAAYPPEEEPEEEQEEVVEQFREFIDSVNPEDFAS
jgi:bifunctional DNase/RNase